MKKLQTLKQLGRTIDLTSFTNGLQLPPTTTNAPAFVSLQMPEEYSPTYCTQMKQMLTTLKELGYYIIADVSKVTYEYFQVDSLEQLQQQLPIDAYRLDFGFSVQETISLSRHFPIVVNASTCDEETAIAFKEAQADILAMFNYYPRPETGLDEDFMHDVINRLHTHGIRVAAFIAGDERKRGPIYKGLVTLEKHRYMTPMAQFVNCVEEFDLDMVLVGDPGVSTWEIKRMERYLNEQVTMIKADIDPQYSDYEGKLFTIRVDSPNALLRIEEGRSYNALAHPKIPKLAPCARTKGSLTIDNEAYARYKGELQLTRKDYPADEKVNVIGHICEEDLDLLDQIQRGDQIVFITRHV